MKKILIEIAKVLQLSLIGAAIITLTNHLLFSVALILWGVVFYYLLRKETSILNTRLFTMVELVAVISIMSVMISITVSVFGNVDKDKRDIQVLHSQLMKQQLNSLKYASQIYKVEYEDLYTLPVPSFGDVYFKSGVPVNLDGSPYIGCKLTIRESFIKINAFTGKFSFY